MAGVVPSEVEPAEEAALDRGLLNVAGGDVADVESGLVAYCENEVVPDPVCWRGGRLRDEEEEEEEVVVVVVVLSLGLLRPISGRNVGGIIAVPALAAAPAI